MIPLPSLCSVGKVACMLGYAGTAAQLPMACIWACIQPTNKKMPQEIRDSMFCKWVEPRDVPYIHMTIVGLACMTLAGFGHLLMNRQAQCTLAEYFN